MASDFQQAQLSAQSPHYSPLLQHKLAEHGGGPKMGKVTTEPGQGQSFLYLIQREKNFGKLCWLLYLVLMVKIELLFPGGWRTEFKLCRRPRRSLPYGCKHIVYYTLLYYTILYYTILYYAILYHTIEFFLFVGMFATQGPRYATGSPRITGSPDTQVLNGPSVSHVSSRS